MSLNAPVPASVSRFQSEIAGLRWSSEPLTIRATVFTLAIMVLAFGLLLTFARVDRVVSSTSGRIVSVDPPSVFQSLDPSIVKSMDVKEGQIVEAGQLLATLDPTFANADVTQLKQQMYSLDAQIIREEAELAGKAPIFPPGADEERAKYDALQKRLFDVRSAQYAAQILSYDQKIAQTQATIDKYKGDEERFRERLGIADEVHKMRSTLLKTGAGSLLNVLVSTDAKLEALRTMEFGHNSLVEAQHQAESLKADRDAFHQQWFSSVSQELVAARNSRDNARSALEKATKHHDLVRLLAPQRSMVLSVAKLSPGSVLKEGDTLLTLAPMSAPLEAEIQIATRDVGFLRPGDPATMKIEAFNFAEHGTIAGALRWVSEDAFTVDGNGTPVSAYYRARIRIEAVNLIDVPGSFRLIPGMTLLADVKVGSRSLGSYLLGGVIRGVSGAMREP